MIGPIQCRSDQIVHAGVDHDEPLATHSLEVEDLRDENSGIAHDEPTRLQDQLHLERRDPGEHGFCKRLSRLRSFVFVDDP